jgi:hypothetical protein
VVHLDAKSALWTEHRARIEAHPSRRVFVVENPVPIFWATESQLVATKRMLQVALKHDFTLAHHISGSDWPVSTRAQMVADIESDGLGCAYAEILGASQSERMQGLWLSSKTWGRLPDPPRVRLIRVWVAANKRLVPRLAKSGIERSRPLGPWQKGWSWWSLPPAIAADACEFIEQMLHSGRLRATVCSDEHVIPTVLANRHAERIRPYRRFIEWHDNDSHPQTITVKNMPAISQSGAWFTRKCDMATDDFFLTTFPEFNPSKMAELQASLSTKNLGIVPL